MPVNGSFILTLSCPDRPGIVAGVSGALFRHGGNILQASQFDDVEAARFFMRVVFAMDDTAQPAFAAEMA